MVTDLFGSQVRGEIMVEFHEVLTYCIAVGAL